MAYHNSRQLVVESSLQLWNELVGDGRLLVPAGADLDGDAARGQLSAHSVQNLEQAVRFGHEGGPAAAVADEIDRTSRIEILLNYRSM